VDATSGGKVTYRSFSLTQHHTNASFLMISDGFTQNQRLDKTYDLPASRGRMRSGVVDLVPCIASGMWDWSPVRGRMRPLARMCHSLRIYTGPSESSQLLLLRFETLAFSNRLMQSTPSPLRREL
jgi:hypothetical protein